MQERYFLSHNKFGQPIGLALPNWTQRPLPPMTPMIGRYCSVEALDVGRHAADLYSAFAEAPNTSDWTYLFTGPYGDLPSYIAYLQKAVDTSDPAYFAITLSGTGKPVGSAALMRIDPANGTIEVGHIHYSPRLKHSRAGTEAMYLLMRHVFDELGYRRYEWKCDSLNGPSRRAAERYGFRYEGTFRQAVVYKGRNRDTAWYAIVDQDWPSIRAAFEQWLSEENFDAAGSERRPLRSLQPLQAG